MPQLKQCHRALIHILIGTAGEGISCLALVVRRRSALVAENLFLRKQLAFYQERQTHPKRLTDVARFSLALWSRLFDWKDALVIVRPETLIRWHRKGFKLFWKWKSRAGRPRLAGNIRQLIIEMAKENPTWGQERVADEACCKTGNLCFATDRSRLLVCKVG
jgi:putative transposase